MRNYFLGVLSGVAGALQLKIPRTPDERFAALKGYPIDSEGFPKSDFCCPRRI